MQDLELRAAVVDRTSNTKISGRRLADYVKELHQKIASQWRYHGDYILITQSWNIDIWMVTQEDRIHKVTNKYCVSLHEVLVYKEYVAYMK